MIVLIGFVLLFAVWVGSLVLMVLATIKVASGEDYRYPVTHPLHRAQAAGRAPRRRRAAARGTVSTSRSSSTLARGRAPT